MKITPTQVFLHGFERYEADKDYEVDETLGLYFVGQGWARAKGAEAVDNGDPRVAEVKVGKETVKVLAEEAVGLVAVDQHGVPRKYLREDGLDAVVARRAGEGRVLEGRDAQALDVHDAGTSTKVV